MEASFESCHDCGRKSDRCVVKDDDTGDVHERNVRRIGGLISTSEVNNKHSSTYLYSLIVSVNRNWKLMERNDVGEHSSTLSKPC